MSSHQDGLPAGSLTVSPRSLTNSLHSDSPREIASQAHENPLLEFEGTTLAATPDVSQNLPLALGGERQGTRLRHSSASDIERSTLDEWTTLTRSSLSPVSHNGPSTDSVSPMRRSESLQNTIYYTARTSIPSRASTLHHTKHVSCTPKNVLLHNPAPQIFRHDSSSTILLTSSPSLTPSQLSYTKQRSESLASHIIDVNELEEVLTDDDLNHLPPYLPSTHLSTSLGRSLRETVINRQSMRIFPVEDRVQNRMEELLIRWHLPPSLFHAGEIMNGQHPFEDPDLPIYMVDSNALYTSDGSSAYTGVSSPTIESITRSPFLNRSNTRLSRHPARMLQSAFRETFNQSSGSVSNPVTSDEESSSPHQQSGEERLQLTVIKEQDNSSIQESLDEYFASGPPGLVSPGSGSPSITLSMRRVLSGERSHSPESPSSEQELSNEAITPSAKELHEPGNPYLEPSTAEALPVTVDEVRMMVKAEPDPTPHMPQYRLRVPSYYEDDDEEIGFGFWDAFKEALWGCFGDTYFLLTCCNGCSLDDDSVLDMGQSVNATTVTNNYRP
ncbi:CYFA0S01e02476g1_1 [Cyberlindnera fabianii]|uniref:CYFA0S01e02476g1_1 n=1 Tax=Cyberlindnera fabianii TaxID=36022 RepID=A0A061AG58_CYBFA|nr:CYFA0S01e02476g1_1 [Cyberlindnera fabianii]